MLHTPILTDNSGRRFHVPQKYAGMLGDFWQVVDSVGTQAYFCAQRDDNNAWVFIEMGRVHSGDWAPQYRAECYLIPQTIPGYVSRQPENFGLYYSFEDARRAVEDVARLVLRPVYGN